VDLKRSVSRAQRTALVLQFNEALDPTRAQNRANYQLAGPNGAAIAITSAVYDSALDTVTLAPRTSLQLKKTYTLTVIGTGAQGLSDTSGVLLDGGSNFVMKITPAKLVLTHPPGRPVRRK
jgi:hypothetical protein